MDFKGIAWVGKIQEKLENLCSEVDDLISQETVKYVEDQLQTVGANVKQYCSEFVHDFFIEEDKITDLTDDKSSKEDLDKDSKKEISYGNCLPRPSIAGPFEGEVADLTLKKKADASMHENSIVGVEENPTKEKLVLSEIPKHEARIDDQVTMPILMSAEELNSSLTEGQDSTLANSSDGISDSVPTSNSVVSVGSRGHNVMDSRSSSHSDALSTMSSDTDVACLTDTMTETYGVGFELCDGSAKSHLMPLLGSEMVDASGEEETLDDRVTKPGKETTEQLNEWKLGESCIVVDGNEICSISIEPAKRHSYKKKVPQAFVPRFKLAKDQKSEQQAICYEDLKAGPTEQRRESFAPSGLLKLESASFFESEWEII